MSVVWSSTLASEYAFHLYYECAFASCVWNLTSLDLSRFSLMTEDWWQCVKVVFRTDESHMLQVVVVSSDNHEFGGV